MRLQGKKRSFKRVVLLIAVQIVFICNLFSKTIQSENVFTTNGSTVYHLKTGSLKAGQRAVITASYNGEVKCFSPNGKPIWQSKAGDGFPFDMCVADIDKDGLDEVLVASGDGSIYAFDHDGKFLWKFVKVAPFFQVDVAIQKDRNAIILAGGVEQVLYSISPEGKTLGELKTKHCIRYIRKGNLMNDGREYVAVATLASRMSSLLTLMLIDPSDLSVVWVKENLKTVFQNSGNRDVYRYSSLLIQDLNSDGFDEILFTGGDHGRLYCYDHLGEAFFTTADERIPTIPYRMPLLRHVKLQDDEFILAHNGNFLIVYELDGTCREVIHGNYSYADSYYDPELKTLFMGSSVSGGDEIISIRLDQPGWQNKYKSIKPTGKIAAIEENIAKLNKQIKNFVAPDYQPAPVNVNVIAKEPEDNHFQHLRFTKNIILTQKIENKDELWCAEVDKRWKYDLTADQLVEIVAKNEAQGQNIIIWAGHGSAVFFPYSTFKKVLEAGPKHLMGFVFAEMEGTDQHMQDVVENLLLPIAELCKEHKKVIVFRNKNIFWNGSCYLPFWRKILLNERYSDVFIPGLEETNCRTQELSLAGRIGLWQTGSFNHWACRTVTDNANFDRMFEWGGQQVITHHLRNLISSASMGADVFFSDIHAGPDTESLFEQLLPFYEMIEKGIIQIPQKNELLSLSDFALEMMSPPSPEYIKHGVNGHNYKFPADTNPEMVFNRLDAYWAGAVVDPFDYTSYAFNTKRRLLNFLPETPFGMTSIIPSETNEKEKFKNIVKTDGEFFYNEKGEQFTAKSYQPVVEAALAESAARMPILVQGNVHWFAVRLDESHVRLTLVDPGYLDPADRVARVIFQHGKPIAIRDILSAEILKAHQDNISVQIPMGAFRIIDITY